MLNQNPPIEKAVKTENQKRTHLSDDNKKKMAKAIALVEKLAGSLKVPKQMRGKNIDQIVKEERGNFFKEKYS